jgi:hypothetical protein
MATERALQKACFGVGLFAPSKGGACDPKCEP